MTSTISRKIQRTDPWRGAPWLIAIGLVALVSLNGCAGVSYREIAQDKEDPEKAVSKKEVSATDNENKEDKAARGFRYYDSSPYLLIQTDNDGGLTSEIKWMPDPTKLRQATPYQCLASNSTTLTFKDSVLCQADNIGDGTAIPAAFIDAAQKVAAAFVKSGGAFLVPTVNPKATAPPAYLFKIVKIKHRWTLLGASTGEPLFFYTETPKS